MVPGRKSEREWVERKKDEKERREGRRKEERRRKIGEGNKLIFSEIISQQYLGIRINCINQLLCSCCIRNNYKMSVAYNVKHLFLMGLYVDWPWQDTAGVGSRCTGWVHSFSVHLSFQAPGWNSNNFLETFPHLERIYVHRVNLKVLNMFKASLQTWHM